MYQLLNMYEGGRNFVIAYIVGNVATYMRRSDYSD